MTRRRRILGTSFAIVCMLLALSLAALWWRSRTTIDVLAWTTEQLDPVVAGSALPPGWQGTPHVGAARAFSIQSDDGFIRFARDVYLQRDSSVAPGHQIGPDLFPPREKPPFAMPYPFPQEPGWRCRRGVMMHGSPQPLRVGWFGTTNIGASIRFESGLPARDWDYQSRVVSIPFWAPILLLCVPMIVLLVRLARARRLARVGLCRKCGYDLRASPDRCPECGTTVAPTVTSAVGTAQ